MQKIIIYGIGNDFHVCFGGMGSLYRNMTEEMGITVAALCDSNQSRFGEKILMGGDRVYELKDIRDVLEDSYDYIVVTTGKYFYEVRESLIEKGVEDGKIIPLMDYLYSVYYGGTYLYQLSIVLIIQDEVSYMKEWLEYYRMLGVEHFYIYDNKSTDDLKEFLANYIEKGIVTYQYWEDGQPEAYQHAVDNYKFESKYMAFIDVDEFLFHVDSSNDSSLISVIEGIAEKHWDRMKTYGIQKLLCGGIGVNWRNYGTSGHKKRPMGLVIENYMYRLPEDGIESAHIKTIANPRTVQACHPHHMDYISGFACLSENGSYITDMVFFDGHCEQLRLNHYHTRSEEELHYKMCERGYSYLKDISSDEWHRRYLHHLEIYSKLAVVYDPAISRFIAPLRERLNALEN